MFRLVRKLLRVLRRLIAALVFGLLAGGLWSVRQGALELAPPPDMPDHDYLPDIQALVAANRIPEALCLCDAVIEMKEMPNAPAIVTLAENLRREHSGLAASAQRFAAGFLTGSIGSGEELVGTVLSDFLVVGDVRDLARQGVAKWRGEETDPVIAALSAAGLASSVASFFPPTAGAAAPADAGIGVMKALRRSGALTQRFADQVATMARAAARGGEEAAKMGRVMGDAVQVALKSPPGALGPLMRHVDDAADLSVLRRWVGPAPAPATAALMSAGPDALRWMARAPAAATGDLLLRVLRKGPAGFKWLTAAKAGGKLMRKVGLGELRDLFARELALRPSWMRAALLLTRIFAAASGLYLAALLWALAPSRRPAPAPAGPFAAAG